MATAILVCLLANSLVLAATAGLGFALGRGLVHPFRRTDPLHWDAQLRQARRWFSWWLTVPYAALVLNLLVR
ncbi:MAG: hypothetical protein ACRCYU_22730 [Nocardioides sp.]